MSEQVVLGNSDVVEPQSPGRITAHAESLPGRQPLYSRRVALHDETAEFPGISLSLRLQNRNNIGIGMFAAGHELFFASDAVLAALLEYSGFRQVEVGSCPGFGKRQSGDVLPKSNRTQKFFFVFERGFRCDYSRSHIVHRETERGR